MKIKILVSSLVLFLSGGVVAQMVDFPDVQSDQWYYPFVMQIKDWNVVNGNDDGTFAPDRNINRAEFSKMIVRYDERVTSKIDEAILGIDFPEHESTNLPSFMHLDRDNSVPKNCPDGWEEVQYGRIYENDNSLNRRTCMTDQACQVMGLRNRDVEPPDCPANWSEADFGRTDNREEQRVCYICQS